ncbi:MAG: NADH:ubiquinone reductase (Na(+)-transporting) subunit C [Bacteroidetes bacterium]|nr:NADH:ubiquinone reductase (Na(+)-transporting) subunit C [Bacteroidota bacterium]
MSKHNNSYILVFMITLSVFSAVILAFISESLKPAQIANIELEKKKSILGTFIDVSKMSKEEINALYAKKVKTVVVSFDAQKLDIDEASIKVSDEYRKDLKDRKLPVYEIFNDKGEIEYSVLPFFGHGLYDNIWGYIAVEPDMKTIKGVVLDNKGETPGLGARMSEKQIADRYQGKTIRDDMGNIVTIVMQKGEKGGGEASIKAYENDSHKVDGLSGATNTGKGINKMFEEYLQAYSGYLNSKLTK